MATSGARAATVGLLPALLLLAACGGQGPEVTGGVNTSPSTPADLALPIKNAARARDALVRTVLGRPTGDDPVDALVQRYPTLRFGSALAGADSRGVSVWWTPRDPYAAETPENPTLFVVAVRDAAGSCAFGAASGVGVFQDGSTATADPEPCTAEAARHRLGLDPP